MKPDLTKISPLPWRVGPPDHPIPDDCRLLADCGPVWIVSSEIPKCRHISYETDQADAAYIVHAANNLPKLLAALKAISEYKFDCECVVPSQMATIALKALKAAGEL